MRSAGRRAALVGGLLASGAVVKLLGAAWLSGFLTALALVAFVGTARDAARRSIWRDGILCTAEALLALMLIVVLALPLAALLPAPWSRMVEDDQRLLDMVVILATGMTLWVAIRAALRRQQRGRRQDRAEREAANARAELAERERSLVRAELQVLRAQIEPHFLWNTLANIEYLIRVDAERAHAMLGDLITYLRSGVPSQHDGQATLGGEFTAVRAYLALMYHRMGSRLHTEVLISHGCTDIEFPPSLLQTLVENAIKHGLEPRPGDVRLVVSARIDPSNDDRVRIDVIDNGVGLQPNPATRGTGLGLRNVREHLRALAGDLAALTIQGNDSGGVTATIVWPRSGLRQVSGVRHPTPNAEHR